MSAPATATPANAEPTGALAALVFLMRRSGRNRLRVQLGRLKNVRYVLGLLFLVLYFGSIVRQQRAFRVAAGGAAQALIGANALAVITVAFLLLVALSRAEARQLLPAPISRTQLVLFKLARSHVAVLFSAIIITFVSRRGSNVLPFPLRVLSYVVMLGTFQLHQLGATLTRTGGRPVGEPIGRRAWVVGGVVVVLIVLLITASVVPAWPAVMASYETGIAMDRLREALYSWPALLVVAPARAVVAPLSAQSLGEWARTFPVAVAIWLAHVPWILANRTPFEEAAVAAGERREALRAAIRAQRATGGRGIGALVAARAALGKKTYVARRTWLPLAPTGRPWVAIVWKNFIPTIRQLRWVSFAVWMVMSLAIAGVVAWANYQSTGDLGESLATGRGILAFILAGIAVLATLVGPLVARNDFRSDLPYLRLLRSYPLDSGALVGAEIASSAVVIFGFQVILLLVALLIAPVAYGGRAIIGIGERLVVFVALVLVLATLDVLSVTVRNAVALFFPGWVRLGGEGGGFEAIGQNLLGTAGSLLLLTLLLIVPALATGAVLYGIGFTPRSASVGFSLLVPLVVFVLSIAAELWFLFKWLGTVYDNIDAGEILEPA